MASLGKMVAAKFTVVKMAPSYSLLLDGVVDVGIMRSLTLLMTSSVLLELVVGLCGGIMASSEKMVALASLFLDAVGAVWVKFVLIAFHLGMLDPPRGWLLRFLSGREIMSEVADVFRIQTLHFTKVKCE